MNIMNLSIYILLFMLNTFIESVFILQSLKRQVSEKLYYYDESKKNSNMENLFLLTSKRDCRDNNGIAMLYFKGKQS